jgi:hypothetical protein
LQLGFKILKAEVYIQGACIFQKDVACGVNLLGTDRHDEGDKR